MKDLNFFEGIKKQEEKQKIGKFMRNGIIALVVCAAAVGGIYGWLLFQEREAGRLAAQIDSEIAEMKAASSDYQAFEQNKQKLAALQTYNSIIATFTGNLAAYPHADQALMDEIRSKMPDGVEIAKVSYAGNIFKMECTANNTSAPADFVRSLRTSERIEDVSYNGYYTAEGGAVLPDAEGQAETVTFSVSCALAGGDAE